jgi:hypothetical protein
MEGVTLGAVMGEAAAPRKRERIKLSDIQRQKLGTSGGRMSWQRRREWELEHPE